MTDLLQEELTGAPVTVTIAGVEYPLTYGMAAVIAYKLETARIERSRPQVEDPDPMCLCGERKSRHSGPSLTIVENDVITCYFRRYDPRQGDSLTVGESWKRIDLDVDPERWLACLWAGMHRLSKDGTKWESPLSLAELGTKLPVGAGTRDISLTMVRALNASSAKVPKKDPRPNAAAPGELAPPVPTVNPTTIKNVESTGSTPAHVVVSDSLAQSS
jgi:hypothetical protein